LVALTISLPTPLLYNFPFPRVPFKKEGAGEGVSILEVGNLEVKKGDCPPTFSNPPTLLRFGRSKFPLNIWNGFNITLLGNSPSPTGLKPVWKFKVLV
jgi:hypothetical protein